MIAKKIRETFGFHPGKPGCYGFFETTASVHPKDNVQFEIGTDTTNCKLSYIHGLGQLSSKDSKHKKSIMNELLKFCKGCVIINTIKKDVTDFISETYPTYYYQKVPIGYSGEYQYHICIKNTISTNGSCRRPIKDSNLLTIK